MKHRSDEDLGDFPVILGFGSCHTLTDYGPATPKRKGKANKPRRIGFHIPKKAAR